jgi:hypothetical protein
MQFSFTSQSDVNAAPSDETSRPARRVSPGHRFKDGLRPRAAALWRPLYGESAGLGIVKRSLRNDDPGMPCISLRCTDYRLFQLPDRVANGSENRLVVRKACIRFLPLSGCTHR